MGLYCAPPAAGAQTVTISALGDDNTLTVTAASTLDTDVVTLIADKMDITAAAITSTMGRIIVKPAELTDAINLGSTVDTTGDTLELSNAELDNLIAATLEIGSDTGGAIDVVTADIDDTGSTTLHLKSGGTVTAVCPIEGPPTRASTTWSVAVSRSCT